jgi:anthranilate synthase/aminodeoxychorismate synthase-like glutamine amidotransferase
VEAVRAFRGLVPMLGVCLGHQAIAAALGGRIIRGRQPVHGRTSRVRHDAVNLFAGIPDPMTACRYHSLVVDPATLSEGLVAVAHDEEGPIMAVSDERQCVHGVQFHPESILTRPGFRLLANFLELGGVPHASRMVGLLDDHLAHEGVAHGDAPAPAERVVTF